MVTCNVQGDGALDGDLRAGGAKGVAGKLSSRTQAVPLDGDLREGVARAWRSDRVHVEMRGKCWGPTGGPPGQGKHDPHSIASPAHRGFTPHHQHSASMTHPASTSPPAQQLALTVKMGIALSTLST